MEERVYFFSLDDMSIGYYLELAEKAIIKYETTAPSSIDDVVELFHIKKLFDNDCRLTRWTEDEFNRLKDLVKGYNSIIVRFFQTLSPNQVEVNYGNLDWGYRQAFWNIIDQFKLFTLISDEVLRRIVQKDMNDLRAVLNCKSLVDKYKVVIREVLLNNKDSAKILIDKYIARHDNSSDRELYLPQILTMQDKETIIANYLNSEHPNLNYVRLICQNKDERNCLVLSPIVKVKANRLAKKLNDELMRDERAVTVEHKVSIEFSSLDGLPYFSYKKENGYPEYVYSTKFIEQCNNTQLIANCCYLFGWMNRHFLLELISKESEVGAFELSLFDRSKNAYPSFSYFIWKNDLSCSQLYGYNEVLLHMRTSFEKVLKCFYESHLKEEYNYPVLTLNYPNIEDSWLNKCRILFPELDSIVKQYNTYVEYDDIDIDIIRLSNPLKVTEGKSLLIKKYYEVNNGNEEIRRILCDMFTSGVSLLNYVEPYKKDNKYQCLYDLLIHEVVFYDNYKTYQKREIDFLISRNVLSKDDSGRLLLVNKEQAIALRSLWEYHACAYWHYNDGGRKALDEMFAKGWLVRNDNLLTTEECKYFSYYLDNSKFTNGPAYRNNYAHGSTPPRDDEVIHKTAYLTLLRLLTILILKIEDDLWSARRVLAIECAKK